jgi:hypothetical protein
MRPQNTSQQPLKAWLRATVLAKESLVHVLDLAAAAQAASVARRNENNPREKMRLSK